MLYLFVKGKSTYEKHKEMGKRNSKQRRSKAFAEVT
jgi:hypothetical protein